MRNGKLDLGQFGPLGYVFADAKAGAEPLVSFGTAEKELSTYTAGIWVPKDSPIQAIGDLKGKSLALGSVGSTSGDVLPRFGLREAGIADADIKMDYTGGHPEALLALDQRQSGRSPDQLPDAGHCHRRRHVHCGQLPPGVDVEPHPQ